MDIHKVDIKYFSKDSYSSFELEGVCHVKVLPWFSVVQSAEGSYDIGLGSHPVKSTGPGGIFVAPSGVRQTIVHHTDPVSGRMRYRYIFLDTVINNAYPLDFLYDFPTIVPEPERTEISAIFDELFMQKDVFLSYACCLRILSVLMRVAVPKQMPHHHAVGAALEYIRTHYAEQIRVEDLADRAGMSPSNFYAVFRKQMGVSPIAYINHYRLSLAVEHLLQSDASVSDTASAVGIQDPLYFSKLFRRTFQVSPKEYRRMHRDDMEK